MIRTLLRVVPSGAALLALALTGCMTHPAPSIEQVKGVRVLESADPATLVIFGVVEVQTTVADNQAEHAQELTLDKLKDVALRRFPDTTVLFDVSLRPGDCAHSTVASGIAARRRGS